MPGVARQLLTFLASPRKVSKRRRPQVRRPAKNAGFPALLTNAGRCGTRARKRPCAVKCAFRSPSNSPRGNLPRLLRCSATLMGTQSRYMSIVSPAQARGQLDRNEFPQLGKSNVYPRSSQLERVPMRVAEQRRNDRGRPRGLFEADREKSIDRHGGSPAEFRSRLSFRVAQGTPRFCGPTNLGSPFFAYFLWRSKESE